MLYQQSSNEHVRSVSDVIAAADAYISTAHSLLLRTQLAKARLKPSTVPVSMATEIGVPGVARHIRHTYWNVPSFMPPVP